MEVQPIKDKRLIDGIKRELKKMSYRDYLLFSFGINVGLRISDILNLKVKDVRGKIHILIKEQKTGKTQTILINSIGDEIMDYTERMNDDDYLFPSRKGKNSPITRIQAYRILNEAGQKAGFKDNIGTHTIRKTFGYHFYNTTHDIATLMEIFNHSSEKITKKYIGMNQEHKDNLMRNFRL